MQNYMGLAWTYLMSVYRRILLGSSPACMTRTEKKIYEGDIVEQIVTNGYNYGFIGEVSFDNGVFGIKHKTYKGYIVSSFVYSSDWNDGHAHGTVLYEYELKGNIYDNPELIKEEL
ncbi:YopX family protein [Bacteroides fragilis]